MINRQAVKALFAGQSLQAAKITASKGNFDISEKQIKAIKTPSYIIDEAGLKRNLEILDHVQKSSGAHILLALKAFSTSACFELISTYLKGTTASSLYEAKLGHDTFNSHVHVYSPAYTPVEFKKLLPYASHIVMNSFSQWNRVRHLAALKPELQIGMRVNPGYSEVEKPIYDPCAKHSRFGVSAETLSSNNLDGISGLHFHALCQQSSDVLERVWGRFEQAFGSYLHKMKWINIGGGHLITDPNYDTGKLIQLIRYIRDTYDVEVYLEPGEAVVYRAGYLVTSVVDTGDDNTYAIVDASASAHMPDVLEMPYRPHILESGNFGEHHFNYHIGGPTCLSGDVIGSYSFKKPLTIGDKLILTDMAQYTIVKNTSFNGVRLPSIQVLRLDGSLDLIKAFTYSDFKSRVG